MRLIKNPKNRLLEQRINGAGKIKPSILADMRDLIDQSGAVEKSIQIIVDAIIPDCTGEEEAFCTRLIDMAGEYGSDWNRFLGAVSLGTSVDAYRPATEDVALMTLHSAKGLEFSCVFIIGCEDGLLPFSLLPDLKSDYEEERRLFYVGMTRAKRYLFLSSAQRRLLYGRQHRLAKSPFLSRIEKELTESLAQEHHRKKLERETQLSLF
jgi:hypothetical protein